METQEKAAPQTDSLTQYIEMEKKAYEPLNWDERKKQVTDQFRKEFGGMEVFLNEGGDWDLDRPIRLGKGKSRLD